MSVHYRRHTALLVVAGLFGSCPAQEDFTSPHVNLGNLRATKGTFEMPDPGFEIFKAEQQAQFRAEKRKRLMAALREFARKKRRETFDRVRTCPDGVSDLEAVQALPEYVKERAKQRAAEEYSECRLWLSKVRQDGEFMIHHPELLTDDPEPLTGREIGPEIMKTFHAYRERDEQNKILPAVKRWMADKDLGLGIYGEGVHDISDEEARANIPSYRRSIIDAARHKEYESKRVRTEKEDFSVVGSLRGGSDSTGGFLTFSIDFTKGKGNEPVDHMPLAEVPKPKAPEPMPVYQGPPNQTGGNSQPSTPEAPKKAPDVWEMPVTVVHKPQGPDIWEDDRRLFGDEADADTAQTGLMRGFGAPTQDLLEGFTNPWPRVPLMNLQYEPSIRAPFGGDLEEETLLLWDRLRAASANLESVITPEDLEIMEALIILSQPELGLVEAAIASAKLVGPRLGGGLPFFEGLDMLSKPEIGLWKGMIAYSKMIIGLHNMTETLRGNGEKPVTWGDVLSKLPHEEFPFDGEVFNWAFPQTLGPTKPKENPGEGAHVPAPVKGSVVKSDG